MEDWSIMEFLRYEDSYASDSEDSDLDINYASVIHGFINGHTLGSSIIRPSYITNGCYQTSIPTIKTKPDTDKLVGSQFALSTQLASEGGALSKKWKGNGVANMVIAREKGIPMTNSFSYSNKCKLNNQFLPNEMEMLDRNPGKMFCGIFSKDGEYFMTAAQDSQISIYDSKYGGYKELNEIRAKEVEWSIIDVAFSPNREHIVYTTWNSSIQLCSIHDASYHHEILRLSSGGNRFCAFSVAFSDSGDEVLAAANNGCIYIYNLERRKPIFKMLAHNVDVNALALASESSTIIYTGGDDGLIKVWDRRTLNERSAKPVGILSGHLDGITYIDSRGDGRHLISNSKDQSIKLWDIRAFSSKSTIERSLKALQVQTWDYRWQKVPKKMYKQKKIEGDSSLMTYQGHVVMKTLLRCKFSPIATTGQRYIYTGCGLGHVIIYDALTGKIKRRLTGHHRPVRDVSWHPYRNEILSSSWDGIVGLWKYAAPEDFSKEENNDDPSTDSLPQSIRRSERLAQKRRREQY